MSRAKVKMKLNEAGLGYVEVNGERLPTRKVMMTTGVNQLTVVTLELVNVEIEAELEAAAIVIDKTTTEDEWEVVSGSP